MQRRPAPRRGGHVPYREGRGIRHWLIAIVISTSSAPHHQYKHPLSPHRLRAVVYRTHPCLAHIVDRENPGWDVHRWNSAGSGAYGLPQALPARKMASAGRDWRSNPWTQLRWMRRYVRARYGGECAAWSWWQAHSSY